MYFASLDLADTNLDAVGRTLLYDYQNGIDPNVISFWPSMTNRYVNSMTVPIQLNITAGIPFYMAALADSTNFSTANWTPYNSNIIVTLDSVEGWHTVWVGLSGSPWMRNRRGVQFGLNLFLPLPS
jgi:hypothetical protein